MEILVYDEVDPLEVLQLNLLGLEFALTPKRVRLIRHKDPRVFPFFALYASIKSVLVGQVGVFKLPMVSIEGPEDVGGVWAVVTHPSYKRQGIAKRLLTEAHERMRGVGLRFSTLGTSSFRVAYSLYLSQGYQSLFSSASILITRSILLRKETRMTATQSTSEQLNLVDDLFRKVSVDRLGFTRRFEQFISVMVQIGEIALGRIEEKNIWLLWKDNELVGYFFVVISDSILNVIDILLSPNINIVSAITSLVEQIPIQYIQIKLNHPLYIEEFSQLGAKIVHQSWSAFMMKLLNSESANLDLKHYFGLDTDRFLFSNLDIT